MLKTKILSLMRKFWGWWTKIVDKIVPDECEKRPDLPPVEQLAKIYKMCRALDALGLCPLRRSLAWRKRRRVNYLRQNLHLARTRRIKKYRGVCHVG